MLFVGVGLGTLIMFGCAVDEMVDQPSSDMSVNQYLNSPDASENTETDIDRANREWLEEPRQNSRLNRHP